MQNFPIHPTMQFIGILCMLYAWYSGFTRFRMRHLKHKSRFNWKWHVRMGLAGSFILLAGIAVGLYTVNARWHTLFVTGLHWQAGLLMIPLILFAVVTGRHMDRNKKKRNVLPIVHGISNTVMLIIALVQAYTGISVYIENVYYIDFVVGQ